jgi:hypothetical protein
VQRMLHSLQMHFCWPGLRGDVERYVRTCGYCQLNKPFAQPPSALTTCPLPHNPFEEFLRSRLRLGGSSARDSPRELFSAECHRQAYKVYHLYPS